jgi:hypothetical protein
MVGASKVRKKVWRGIGLASLFPLLRHAFETDRSTRAGCISSSVIPFRESVVVTLWEGFKDVCLYTCVVLEPRKLRFTEMSGNFSLLKFPQWVPFFSVLMFFTFPEILPTIINIQKN